MTQINPYLTLDGTCRDAMTFYKECLGGELFMQTIGESPMAEQMPDMKEKIMHASLTKEGSLLLMASDMCKPEKVLQGNTVSLSLNCSSEEEIKDLFAKLSADGTITMPLEDQFWGAIFGQFTDKFGMLWMLNYHKEPKA